MPTLADAEELFALARAALDEALAHDALRVAEPSNPWKFSLYTSAHLHERVRSLLWAAELALRLAQERAK